MRFHPILVFIMTLSNFETLTLSYKRNSSVIYAGFSYARNFLPIGEAKIDPVFNLIGQIPALSWICRWKFFLGLGPALSSFHGPIIVYLAKCWFLWIFPGLSDFRWCERSWSSTWTPRAASRCCPSPETPSTFTAHFSPTRWGPEECNPYVIGLLFC